MYYGNESFVMTLLFIYLLIFGIILLISLAAYIIQGIGMYTLGKKRGLENPWLAFIPYARKYYQGELCGPLTFKNREIKNPGIWMLLVPIIANVITGTIFGLFWAMFAVKITQAISFSDYYYDAYSGIQNIFSGFGSGVIIFGFIAVMLFTILADALQKVIVVIVNNQIFARHTEKNYALLHAVFGIFIPLYTAIYFFIIRNRE